MIIGNTTACLAAHATQARTDALVALAGAHKLGHVLSGSRVDQALYAAREASSQAHDAARELHHLAKELTGAPHRYAVALSQAKCASVHAHIAATAVADIVEAVDTAAA
jgi:hypothetical protein